MKRLYSANGYTKAQRVSGSPANLYNGPSFASAKAALIAPVAAGTYSFGIVISNTFQGERIVARNPAGT